MIKLTEKYYLVINSYEYTLKQLHIVKTKDGLFREEHRVIGHYYTLDGVAKGIVRKELDLNLEGIFEMKEYLEAYRKRISKVLSRIKELEK